MFSHDCAQYETQIVYICMQKHGYFFNLHKWGRYSAGSKTWPRDQPPDLEKNSWKKSLFCCSKKSKLFINYEIVSTYCDIILVDCLLEVAKEQCQYVTDRGR